MLAFPLWGCSAGQEADIFLSEEPDEEDPSSDIPEEDSYRTEEEDSAGQQTDLSQESEEKSAAAEKKSSAAEAGNGEEPSAAAGEATEVESPSQPEQIFVDVCGAVAKPGVYGMPPDSRVFQAVEMAGGFLPEAAGAYINQAQPLSDGQQIYVPTEEEVLEKELPVPAAETADSGDKRSGGAEEDPGQEKVNLNTADSAALQTLSGIGEAKAEAILAYREEHGGFSSIEEIMNVPGIKESTFSNIKDKIAVE